MKDFVDYVCAELRKIQNNNCNHGHNIGRIFDVLPNLSFTKSETKPDY